MYKQKLYEEGIPPHLKGFRYLNAAIKMYDPGINIAKLCADVALEFNSTSPRVERAMRHAIPFSENPARNCDYIAARKMILRADCTVEPDNIPENAKFSE